jgi:ABC-type branched-subunit amino acid transport system permease subunit
MTIQEIKIHKPLNKRKLKNLFLTIICIIFYELIFYFIFSSQFLTGFREMFHLTHAPMLYYSFFLSILVCTLLIALAKLALVTDDWLHDR